MSSTPYRGSSAAYKVLWSETLRSLSQVGKIPSAELPSLEANEALILEFEHARAGHAAYNSTSATPADTAQAIYRKYLTEKKTMAQSVMQILVDENKQLRERIKLLEAIIEKHDLEHEITGDAAPILRSRKSSVEVSIGRVLKSLDETANSMTTTTSSSRRVSRQSSMDLSHMATAPITPDRDSIVEEKVDGAAAIAVPEGGIPSPTTAPDSSWNRSRRMSWRNSQILQFANPEN